MDNIDNEKTLHDEAKHLQKFEEDYENAKEKKEQDAIDEKIRKMKHEKVM